jgi:hypothetical protein
MYFQRASGFALFFVFQIGGTLSAQDQVTGNLIQFNDNGAWSWFEDERAIIDQGTGQLLVSTANDSSGTGGRADDVEVVSYSLSDGTRTRFCLNDSIGGDDHNSAALLIRSDDGASFSYGGRLFDDGNRGTRPYVKYASNNNDTIHLINTEQHPRNFDNSIYHSFIKGGKLFNSSGTVIDEALDECGVQPNLGTKIFSGNSNNVAWASDVQLDGEDDYTGNITLDPNHPDVVFLSADVNPSTGAALISSADHQRHYEIFKGTTIDQGANWNWSAITENSTVDNLRPIVPRWDPDNQAVLWLRGTYTSYTNFDLAVVGVVEQANQRHEKIGFFDANTSNTTLADGSPVNPTTSGTMGAADQRWHVRIGFGNQNSVFTSDESGSESVGMLMTTITNTEEEGFFDVFAYFWSSQNEQWEFQSGLNPADMMAFRKQGAKQALDSEFLTSGVITTGSDNITMYQAYLGQVFLAHDARQSVFIDDAIGSQSSVNRTWYDGIGLSRVTKDGGAR